MAQLPRIRVDHLVKEFAARRSVVRALDDVSFSVREGLFLSIVGPSGCGKTTLLRILAGLEEETSGRVSVTRSDPSRPLNAMVFQEQSVLPWLTVRNNIGYGLYLRRADARERRAVVDHYLQVTGLTRFADAYPHQLSGGMKQRVSVARAFATDPEILLMDEPFAALDEQNKILLQQELLRLWEGSNKTVIYITHSIDEALNLSDRIMVMTAHPGRIKATIDVDLPRPRNIIELRTNPRFQLLFSGVWGLLREEVRKAKLEEGLEVESF